MLDVEAVCFELQGNLQALNAEKEAVLKERMDILKENADFVDRTDTNNRNDVDLIVEGVNKYIKEVNEEFLPTLKGINAPMAPIVYEKNLFGVGESVKHHALAITKHQIEQTRGRVDTIASTTPILIILVILVFRYLPSLHNLTAIVSYTLWDNEKQRALFSAVDQVERPIVKISMGDIEELVRDIATQIQRNLDAGAGL